MIDKNFILFEWNEFGEPFNFAEHNVVNEMNPKWQGALFGSFLGKQKWTIKKHNLVSISLPISHRLIEKVWKMKNQLSKHKI